MEKVVEESKSGLYDVYYTTEGTRLIVLDGLRADEQIALPPLQLAIHEHYTSISFIYWIIFAVTLIYMAGIHLIVPLLKKSGLY